mgnify:CR=1 FL=1
MTKKDKKTETNETFEKSDKRPKKCDKNAIKERGQKAIKWDQERQQQKEAKRRKKGHQYVKREKRITVKTEAEINVKKPKKR